MADGDDLGLPSPRRARPHRLWSGVLEQMLPDEFALDNSTWTSEEATAGMGHELVEHVELRQLVKDADKAGPGIALIAYKEDSSVIFHALVPRRPPLRREIHAVIVRVGPP
jgi:hypothetical protein